jgi:hypothetical protein
MGLIRAGWNVGKAAVQGGSGADIAKAGVKGMLPRSMGGIVDKVATPNNISRVTQGVRNVVDSGRTGTFQSSTNPIPPSPSASSDDLWGNSSSSSLPPPSPSSNHIPGWDD